MRSHTPPLQPRLTLPDISSPAGSHLPWLEPALSPPSAIHAALAMRSMVSEHEGMVIACSGTSAAMLAMWHEELRALKPSRRGRWHAKLRDTPGGALKVRYTGEVRYFNIEDERVP